jgi:hypothetical protein
MRHTREETHALLLCDISFAFIHDTSTGHIMYDTSTTNRFVDSREETQHYKHVKIVSLDLEGENKIYVTYKIVKIKPD